MSRSIARREFVRQSAAVIAGSCSWLGKDATAIEPIVRSGPPRFKLGLSAYSYRDLLVGDSPQLTLTDFVDDCAKMNLDAAELTSYFFPSPLTDDYLRQLKKQCFRLGLDVSGTAVGNDFGFPPGEKRERQIDSVKRWIEHAEVLGAPVIRIFAGKQKEEASVDQTHKWMVEGIEACCDYAGKHGVYLALENHGGPTATPDEMLMLVRAVKSPWFGVNLDSGNFFTDDPYADLEKIAPYAINVQVKVVTAKSGKRNKKPTDYARLAQILRDAGYRGYVVLEYEEPGDPREECPRHLDALRKAFG